MVGASIARPAYTDNTVQSKTIVPAGMGRAMPAPTVCVNINVGGALHAEDWDTIRTQNFSITSNGFVRVSAHLEVDTLELNLSGASELEFWGDAHNATIIKNGAGNIFAGNLQTADTAITLNGSGEIEIAVSNTLDAPLEGVGNIRYIGNPTVTQSIGRTAVGSIRKVE